MSLPIKIRINFSIYSVFLMKKKNLGFSLLECLLVTLILAFFLEFAYPSYQTYLHKIKQQEGRLALFDLASRMEAYYLQYGSYEGAFLGEGEGSLKKSVFSKHQWYRLSIQTQSAEHYLLWAVPSCPQSKTKQSYPTLTLDSEGKEGIKLEQIHR